MSFFFFHLYSSFCIFPISVSSVMLSFLTYAYISFSSMYEVNVVTASLYWKKVQNCSSIRACLCHLGSGSMLCQKTSFGLGRPSYWLTALTGCGFQVVSCIWGYSKIRSLLEEKVRYEHDSWTLISLAIKFLLPLPWVLRSWLLLETTIFSRKLFIWCLDTFFGN